MSYIYHSCVIFDVLEHVFLHKPDVFPEALTETQIINRPVSNIFTSNDCHLFEYKLSDFYDKSYF